MQRKLLDRGQKPTRAVLVLGLAAVLLTLLTVSVWAAREATLRSGLLSSLQASLTATPTKTPRPDTPAPDLAPLQLSIVAPPTATQLPPTPTPPPAADAEGDMPSFLAEVSRRYGIDPVRRFVVVDVASQKMLIWDPGHPVRELPVSTGDESRGYRTPAWYGLVGDYVGTFHAFGVYADEGWYLFQDSGKILVHGAPYLLDNGAKIYKEIEALGNYPASRGCVRLSPEDASWFTAWNPRGVPFVILPRPAEG